MQESDVKLLPPAAKRQKQQSVMGFFVRASSSTAGTTQANAPSVSAAVTTENPTGTSEQESPGSCRQSRCGCRSELADRRKTEQRTEAALHQLFTEGGC